MLTRVGGVAILLGLLLAACTPTPEAIDPARYQASYQLLLDDTLVGQALFDLRIDDAGGYRLEAYSVPAGSMATADAHQVLEVSEGAIDAAAIRPQRFEHSVMQGEELRRVRLEFDWAAQRLRVVNDEAEDSVPLADQTHDRLSYLLAAGRLAQTAKDAIHGIRLASLEATEEAVLQVIGQGEVEVPAGRFAATGIRRVMVDERETREMWYAPALGPLPLRVLRSVDGNRVDMQLESMARGELQPGSARS